MAAAKLLAPCQRLKMELPGLVQEYLTHPTPGRPGPEAYLTGLAAAADEHGMLLLDSGRGAFYAPPPGLYRLLFASGEVERVKLPAGKGWKLGGSSLAPVLLGGGQNFQLQDGRFVPGPAAADTFALAVPATGDLNWSEKNGDLVYENAILPGKSPFLKAMAANGQLLALSAGGSEVRVLLWNLHPDWMPAEPMPDGSFCTGNCRVIEFAECPEAGLRWQARLFEMETSLGLSEGLLPCDERGTFRVHSTLEHSATNALRTHRHSEEYAWLRPLDFLSRLPLHLTRIDSMTFRWSDSQYDSSHYGISSAESRLTLNLRERTLHFSQKSDSDSSP